MSDVTTEDGYIDALVAAAVKQAREGWIPEPTKEAPLEVFQIVRCWRDAEHWREDELEEGVLYLTRQSAQRRVDAERANAETEARAAHQRAYETQMEAWQTKNEEWEILRAAGKRTGAYPGPAPTLREFRPEYTYDIEPFKVKP